jgi:hypothetical protein
VHWLTFAASEEVVGGRREGVAEVTGVQELQKEEIT